MFSLIEKNVNTVKIKRSRPPGRKNKPSIGSASRTRDSAPAPRENYHHGHLRDALLRAAVSILDEKGVGAFSLREAARRAGVSPAAPAHHFGDATGLLTAVAFEGYVAFAERLETADRQAGPDPAARLQAQGNAYVRFALENPARFQLMFRSDVVDCTQEGIAAVSAASFETLAGAIRAYYGLAPGEGLTALAYGGLLATWSMVHGFANLALSGQFDGAARALGGPGALLEHMLPAMLTNLPAGRADPPQDPE